MVLKLTVIIFFKGVKYNYAVSFMCSDLFSCGCKLTLVKSVSV